MTFLLQRSVPVTGLTTYDSRLLFGINTMFLILAFIAVLLRLYARKIKRATFVAEDWLVFAAMVLKSRSALVSNGFITDKILRLGRLRDSGHIDLFRFVYRLETRANKEAKTLFSHFSWCCWAS